MNKKLINKKGFTLTELIVVIVIIGILAAVLIPTLTGYISKAKESAAEQEAITYTTAFQTWEIESSSQKQDLASFRNYCVDLELVSINEVEDVILYVDLTTKTYVIKATNGLFVQYEKGKYTVHEQMPVLTAKDVESFYELVIKNNIADVNKGIKDIAQIQVQSLGDDGAADVYVKILDKDAKTVKVVSAVLEVISLIKNSGGLSASAYPMLNDTTAEEYFTESGYTDLENGLYFISLDEVKDLGQSIAAALTFDSSKDYTSEQDAAEWDSAVEKLLDLNEDTAASLSELLNKNTVVVVANISPEGVEPYQVVYNFTFSE